MAQRPLTGGLFSDMVRKKVAPVVHKKTTFTKREHARRVEQRSGPGGFLPDLQRVATSKVDPCRGCSAEATPIKVPALVPSGCRVVALDEQPQKWEVRDGELRPVTHPKLAGVAVGRACVTRCRIDGYAPAEVQDMRRRCRAHLARDLPPGAAVVASGDEAVYALLGSREHGAEYWRGLWFRGEIDDRGRGASWSGSAFAYAPGHPRADSDIERFVRGLDPVNRPQLQQLEIVEDPRRREDLLRWIAAHPGPWAFDIESYDAEEFPSRTRVATDPCHPDFRVRGVAIAWSEDEGAWLELCKLGRAAWRPYLDPIFGSAAKKGGHGAHFDEEGLVYGGWCAEVRNRGEDSMLAMIALSDGRHPSLRLERIAVDVVGVDPWWDALDKSMMRDLPVEQVARAAVFDAGLSLWVVTHAEDMMEQGVYWDGS